MTIAKLAASGRIPCLFCGCTLEGVRGLKSLLKPFDLHHLFWYVLTDTSWRPWFHWITLHCPFILNWLAVHIQHTLTMQWRSLRTASEHVQIVPLLEERVGMRAGFCYTSNAYNAVLFVEQCYKSVQLTRAPCVLRSMHLTGWPGQVRLS